MSSSARFPLRRPTIHPGFAAALDPVRQALPFGIGDGRLERREAEFDLRQDEVAVSCCRLKTPGRDFSLCDTGLCCLLCPTASWGLTLVC